MATASDHRPRLSLCLATYNRARYLERYLTHHLEAFEAAGLDYELVVSDNCSTDETPQILARYASRYPRMRVSRQPRNVGAYPNILTTLSQARGEFVVSIADDDLALTGQLLAYVERMAADPDLRAEDARPDDGRRAYCSVGGAADARLREGDFVFDLLPAMNRFPLFPAEAA